MRYKILKDIDSLYYIQTSWSTIINESRHFEVFQSLEWVISWYLHFCSNQEIFCIVFYDDSEEVVGIVPLAINKDNTLLYFAGSPLNDYNNLIVRSSYSTASIVLRVIEIVTEIYKNVDFFVIDCIDPSVNWITDTEFKVIKPKISFEHDDVSVYLDLPKVYSEYTNTISSKKLKRFIYYERRLLNQEEIEFGSLSPNSNLDEFMSWFKKNKITQWKCSGQYKQVSNQLKKDIFYNFLKMSIQELLKTQKVILPYIKINNQIVASGIYFSFHKKMMKYMQSWDYKYKIYNLGTVLDWMMIKSAVADGFVVFDFGRGNECYKYDLGGKNKHLLRLMIPLR